MGFDISQRAQKRETLDIELADPETGEPLIGQNAEGKPAPMSVTIHAPGTKPYVKAVSDAENRNIRRLQQRGAKKGQTPEEKVGNVATLLTDLTISFNNFDYKPQEFPSGAGGEQNREMFRACYKDIGMGWLTEQVNAGTGDWGNGGAG